MHLGNIEFAYAGRNMIYWYIIAFKLPPIDMLKQKFTTKSYIPVHVAES